jgi:hypothetical protein
MAHKIAPIANPASNPANPIFPPIESLNSSPPTIQDTKKKKRAEKGNGKPDYFSNGQNK